MSSGTSPSPWIRERDLVIGITPFTEPDARLAAAVTRAGALGVLDLGRDAATARTALVNTARWARGPFGVRVPAGCATVPGELPPVVDTVVLPSGRVPGAGPAETGREAARWDVMTAAANGHRRVLVEVTSVAEARAAIEEGADGLIARGCESGGRVGDLTTFTLLQHLLHAELDRPVWAAGGIGPHTAAAAVAGGAFGVVLDVQLALVREMEPRTDVAAAIRAMDGSETTVIAGHRVYVRPDLPAARLTGHDLDEAGVAGLLGARDLRTQLLPIGQDGAFAAPLADRHVTAGGVVAAVRDAVREHLGAAARLTPLAPGAPFAADRGVRLPVAQGPMTRVSDRAEFAKAVADAGGLPFLALALLSGPEVTALLAETAALLDGAPWGVGILGSAPPEIRAAQLAAVSAARPPCALIAGGRPAQSAPLEAAGIDTFLQVPSPALLARFLASGARKFVFEGHECGGHVGPRASFPLWEAQIAGLLAHGERVANEAGQQAGTEFFEGVHVLFAGGVHDERSAAMVAAATAPLAGHGARVGVLMGTAYLFTAEAVDSGAILPGFQQAAVDCERTVLLATSPVHVARCAPSDFVHAFAERKAELLQRGLTRTQVWEELERFNLGRLRIASKGTRRVRDRLVAVDAEAQRHEGMFMIGQVAALRSARTTVDVLHAQVTEGATHALAARAAELGIDTHPGGGRPHGVAGGRYQVREAARPLDVAVIGMACVFPGAADVDEYWANIVGGLDAVTEVPSSRWDPNLYYDPDAGPRDTGRRVASKWGGFLSPVPFDALGFGIPPKALSSIDPGQLLALAVTARALRDAGYGDRPFDRSRTSVVFGAEPGADLASAYGFRSAYPAFVGPVPPALDEHLPTLDENSFPGLLANVIAGRIANHLDLGGVNYTVDAACASSLAALDAACKELVAGTSDLVLCGGVDTHNSIHDFLLFSSVQALSPTGRSRSFDASADGISLGEGVAVVVLKRLADAERAGDRIHAVIKAVAGSSDGRALSMTAARKAGQVLAMQRAYARAGISPADVGLVEAHATGSVVGDRTELASLAEVFTAHGAAPASCALGSVKSQIGHTKCAAGLAGLIKTVKALETGVRPPAVNLSQPNSSWDAASSPFFFDTGARPWAAPASRRHAGVSAFGFGGTNFHAVLSAYDGGPEPAHGVHPWPAELFVVRGTDRIAAGRTLDKLAELIMINDGAGQPWKLRDLAAAVARRRGGTVQVAFVAATLDDLPDLVRRARAFKHDPKAGIFVAPAPAPAPAPDANANAGTADPTGSGPAGGPDRSGQVAFLFPGQGSQRPGMLADVFVAFPRLRHLLERGEKWVKAMFPPAAFTRADAAAQQEAITDTRTAQPVLGMAGLAMNEILTGLGVHPDHLGGHSYGELVALCAAGIIDIDDLLLLSAARAAAILDAASGFARTDDLGTMAAVAAAAGPVQEVLAAGGAELADVVIANRNAPEQTVISGPADAVDVAVRRLLAAGLTARRIPAACAFHSPMVAGAVSAFGAELDKVAVGESTVPVWSNTTAQPYERGADAVRRTLAEQVAGPVRFVDQIEAMYAAGVRIFVEAGPGQVLTGLTGQILAGRPHTAVATDVPGEHGLRRFLLALAELAAAGVTMDTAPLFAGRDVRTVSATNCPRRPGWLVDGHLVRTSDGRCLPGGLRPAGEPPRLAGGEPTLSALPAARPLSPPLAVPAMASPAAVPPEVPAAPAPAAAVVTPAAAALEGNLEGNIAPREAATNATMIEFLRATRDLVAAHRDVMLGYLGTAAVAGERNAVEPAREPAAPAVAPQGRPALLPAQPGPSGPRGAGAGTGAPARPSALPATPALDPPAVLALVLEVIRAATGYPADILEPNLDLESDLGIDSIRRAEILGTLTARAGLLGGATATTGDTVPEELARARTIRGIVDWIVTRPGLDAGAANPAVGPADTAVGPADTEVPPTANTGSSVDVDTVYIDPSRLLANAERERPGAASLRRFVVDVVPLPLPLPSLAEALAAVGTGHGAGALSGARFAVVEGGLGIGLALTTMLERHGATVRMFSAADGSLADQLASGVGADGVLWVSPVDRDAPPALPAAFGPIKAAVAGGTRRLVIATGSGGSFGRSATDEPGPSVGIAGLARTVAREAPRTLVRAVDLDPKEAPVQLAEYLLAEILTPDAPVVVGYRHGIRSAPRVVPAQLSSTGVSVPALGRDSVVLLTGGARGITARVALALARATGCGIELIGRTVLPAVPEDPATAAAPDAPRLRRTLIDAGLCRPAEIEATVARLLAEREVRATVAALTRTASYVRYHAVDVRDTEALRQVVAAVYADRGRIDGVVHGAGTVADKLVRNKTPELSDRIFTTKVESARTLVDALRHDLDFLVLFGSVSGVFGNPGQADYAAANDALDTCAHAWARRFHGRVVSLDWGPWGSSGSESGGADFGGGMVSAELGRQYARRGVGLIDPDAGVVAVLRELAADVDVAQVVYMCGTPEALDGGFPGPGIADVGR
ncbi:type I polyketide synthase [Frankia sp. CIT1]|uniref:type I polyketide synthase n=1 Tax=Frankia sp. CIT1 TaxID=2880974 RepID=UPI001EF69321|nr:type I polyketide synthase [Frankia sp. CIT1]